MSVIKRGKKWYYDFDNHQYRGVIPLARTKAEALQAEVMIKRQVFDGTYGQSQIGSGLFPDFVTETYLPWATANKRSWRTDSYMAQLLATAFSDKSFNEISPLMVEKLKLDQSRSITKRGTQRSRASVNSVLSVGSSIFALAIELEKAVRNPFRKVKKFKLRNQQYRYLMDDEEPLLLATVEHPPAAVVGPSGRMYHRSTFEQRETQKARAHLLTMIPVAVGTGLRRREQLTLQVKHCDFQRRLVIATDTKNDQTRDVPMNDEVHSILRSLCGNRRRDDYVWVNPDTGNAYMDLKRGFHSACREAGIEGLQWKHLRATFGTRLGEAGYNAFEIAALMGHGDIRMTQRYVRATEKRKHEAVQATMLVNRKAAVA